MSTLIQPVLLCGGSGTRLWPLSRAGFPKQFLCLTGNESLFQQAARRLQALEAAPGKLLPPLIVTGEEHRFLAAEQLRECGIEAAAYLLEPSARNTAPALTLAAMAAMEVSNDPVLVVTPADQTIADTTAFTQAVQVSLPLAQAGSIVLLGIPPTRPETGYGYIQAAPDEGQDPALPARRVARFVEKPDAATAAQYLQHGGYYWNAGIFILRAAAWLAALEKHRPDILAAVQTAWSQKHTDGAFIRPGKAAFTQVPSESIDYAVMEPAAQAADTPLSMVPLAAGWSDLGSWEAVWEVLPKDAHGNAHHGDVLAHGCRNTLAHATHRLVALLGVQNLIVVETPDAVLVADKTQVQSVKALVARLEAQHRSEHALHRKVHRPWGWYDEIDFGPRFKVKRICVKPKASLSLQKHHHRAEHWIVVKGTAEVTRANETLLITENQSTYIPLGEVHRLANPGTIPLEIIEVQSGSYLGEDDIVRLEDVYGRG